MTTRKFQKVLKPRDFVAKDLRTSKYRMRVVQSDKVYKRTKLKQEIKKELAYG
jgi:hypothetical protein